MNMESLWDKTCALLSQDMPFVSYSTWIDGNMIPGLLENDTLYITVKMDRMISMIQNKYKDLIEKRLSENAGMPMKIVLLSRDEMQKRLDDGDDNPEPPVDNDPHLNPKYTFESFVVGSGNRFAHAAALAVAESPAEAYNPLFIYGGVGLGKTHLMQAIGHFIHQNDPDKKILYMTSESFTNQLISAIQMKKTYEFRERIRKVDILMVDDIQFIAGRESTQQEFFNTFNELHNDNKQIILTSDKPPKDIQRLVDTRVAILREKTVQEKISVPDDVLQLIAGKIDSNIRELEGCLTRLVAYSNLTREPITMEVCERALKDIFDQRKVKQITAELIMQTVTDYYGLTMGDLTGPTRRREITVPRQIAMYLTREMTGMSLPQIGTVFGGRDHTTIMHSCKVMENAINRDSSMKNLVNTIKNRV